MFVHTILQTVLYLQIFVISAEFLEELFVLEFSNAHAWICTQLHDAAS